MAQATKKKTPTKKKVSKKASRAPGAGKVTPEVLPRGQERLPDGAVRLKTKIVHELGRTAKVYDVHGVRVKLAGKVLVSNKDTDWLSIGKCPKCDTPRKGGITLVKAEGGEMVITYQCHEKKCSMNLTMVMVQSKGRINIA